MNKYSFQELRQIIESRINSISYQRELYKIDENELPDDEGYVDVIYNGNKIVSFHYLITNRRCATTHQVRGSLTIFQALKIPSWYNECLEKRENKIAIHLNEWLNEYGNKNRNIMEVLDEYLPLSKELEISQIREYLTKHDFADYKIAFDTFQRKYVVLLDLKNLLNISEQENKDNEIQLYKYMSLETYCEMLKHGTFRMNSIVSMNDMSETFWVNTLLYGDQGLSKEQKYQGVVKNKNVLISSFSDKEDDPVMWRLYGNSGRGVCLGFTIDRKAVTKIQYINESDRICCVLKEIAKELHNEKIEISYANTDSLQYYIKSTIYNIESEYRLIWDKDEGVQNIAIYDGLLALYKDFGYDKNSGVFKHINLKFTTLIIGNNIPYNESNYPLLVALSDERFKDLRIGQSSIKTFR